MMSIGEVLAHLRADFPDVTISKLRFLEAEGLVEPLRTQAGYRKYSPADVSRLRYVLTAQRDHYLPLRIIREQLAAVEWSGNGGSPAPGDARPGSDRTTVAGSLARPHLIATGDDEDTQEVRLDRRELRERSGLDEASLRELEQHGLLAQQAGGWYDADALAIAVISRHLAGYGLQARHLRAYRVAAERELGLFAQLLAPVLHQSNPAARAKAADTARELADLTQQLQSLLVRVGLRATLGQ